MDRRTFLKTVPAISQSATARALRLVPHANLSNFDPIWSNAYIARNAGILVWDTLYGVDAKLQTDGRSRTDVGRRPDLDIPAAAGT